MLSKHQIEAVDVISKGHNVVITGQAGTGKSFLLHEVYRILSKEGKRVVILCTTGIASLQFLDCRCSTVHSWAGLLDGRYDHLTLAKLVKEDDRMFKIRKNVTETDVLLIDEVSMLSKKDFEQLELVCRTILDPCQNFGGIQVIASGDFYQLPPVGNTIYGDSGQYCFESDIWRSFFVHQINFDKVIRQTEPKLIRAISETGRGCVSNETDLFLRNLNRDISVTYNNPVHLFSTNLDARIFNHERLTDLNSIGRVYEALKNKGSDKFLKRILAPVHLQLKIGCPVILLRNIGGKLVNGLQGYITELFDDEIKVRFDIIHQVHCIQRYNFTVIDMSTHEIVAEREQFPLCLAYGLTIHKSQGMTLDSVIIHCKGIFESGQLSVALGRGTHTAGIQLLNYRKGLCLQPKPAVSKFYGSQSVAFDKDLQCCKKSHTVCIPNIELDFYDSEDSDFEQDNFEENDLFDLMEEETSQNNDINLPDYIDLMEIRNAVCISIPNSERQNQINSVCSSVTDIHLKTFLFENLKEIQPLLPTTQTPTTNKFWTDVLSKYHKYISDDYFKSTLSHLYGTLTLCDIHFFVASKFIYRLLQLAVHKKAGEIAEDGDKEESMNQQISEAGKAKLRYVGGMCVTKCRQLSCRLIENHLGTCSIKKNAKEIISINTEKLTLLRSLQLAFDEIDSSDETFSEIERRQNIRKGLTYINDACFKFFLTLDGKVRSVLNPGKLRQEKFNVFENSKSEILNDKKLVLAWENVTFGFNSTVVYSVFETLIHKFLMVSQKQFLKDMKDSFSLKKKKAHREEIKKKLEKRKLDVELRFEDILEDKTETKIASHLKLKCNSIANREYLITSGFTKQQLLQLANAYSVTFSKSWKKEQLANKLVESILNSESIPNHQAIEPNALVPSTSKRHRTSAKVKPIKGKGKGKGNSNKENYHCGRCGKDYSRNEDWVQCKSCNTWYDRSCAGLDGEPDWDSILLEEIDWECEECQL